MTTYKEFTFLTTNSQFKIVRAISESEARIKFNKTYEQLGLVIDKIINIQNVVCIIWFKDSHRFITIENTDQLAEELIKEFGRKEAEYYCKKFSIEDHFLCNVVRYCSWESKTVVF